MTHTKGPWKIRLQDIYGSDESYICTWSGTIDDARLIAAAPDLLEALEDCMALLHTVAMEQPDAKWVNENGWKSTERLYRQAGEAIQKAKG